MRYPPKETWSIDFVLLPERLAHIRFAPSAPNSMGFSKVLSACSPHPYGHLRALLLRLHIRNFLQTSHRLYSIVHIIATYVHHRKYILFAASIFVGQHNLI